MKDLVFKVLTDNEVYFCREKGNKETTCIKSMIKCFDIFKYEHEWLFYRLADNCEELGYIDEKECLIPPCEEYYNLVSMIRIFESSNPVDKIETMTWIEEEDFNHHVKNNLIIDLIYDVCTTERPSERPSESNNDSGSDIESSGSESSGSESSDSSDSYGSDIESSSESSDSGSYSEDLLPKETIDNFGKFLKSLPLYKSSDGSESSDIESNNLL